MAAYHRAPRQAFPHLLLLFLSLNLATSVQSSSFRIHYQPGTKEEVGFRIGVPSSGALPRRSRAAMQSRQQSRTSRQYVLAPRCPQVVASLPSLGLRLGRVYERHNFLTAVPYRPPSVSTSSASDPAQQRSRAGRRGRELSGAVALSAVEARARVASDSRLRVH